MMLKASMTLGLMPSWCVLPSKGMSKLGSLAENLWDAGNLRSFSDGGETRKQPWHLHAGADFARQPDARPDIMFPLPRNQE